MNTARGDEDTEIGKAPIPVGTYVPELFLLQNIVWTINAQFGKIDLIRVIIGLRLGHMDLFNESRDKPNFQQVDR